MICLFSYFFGYFFGAEATSLLLFNDSRQSLRAFFRLFGDAVFRRDKLENSVEPFLQKLKIHIFRAADEEQVNSDAVSFLEPFGRFFCLQLQIVLAGAYFDLNVLEIGDYGA